MPTGEIKTAEKSATPIPQIPQRPVKNRFFLFLILNVFLSATFMLSALYIYDKHYATKFVKVDYAAFTEGQKTLQVKGESTYDESVKRGLAFNEKIKNIPKNKVIFIIGSDEIIIENAEVIRP